MWNAWRCLTSVGPGPPLSTLWNPAPVAERSDRPVKGVTPGY